MGLCKSHQSSSPNFIKTSTYPLIPLFKPLLAIPTCTQASACRESAFHPVPLCLLQSRRRNDISYERDGNAYLGHAPSPSCRSPADIARTNTSFMGKSLTKGQLLFIYQVLPLTLTDSGGSCLSRSASLVSEVSRNRPMLLESSCS